MSSTSYFYSSTTNTTDAGTTTGHRYSTASTTDVDGLTIVRTAHQDFGQPVVIEERRYDRSGQEQLPLPPTANETHRITDLDEETTSYGDDSGMAIYALSTQDGTMWDPANRGKATYGLPANMYESGSTKKDYEDPSTGARIHRESEIDVSTVL